MAYKSTYKAQAIAEDLKAAIAVRLPSLAQVASNDSEGNPCVLVGAAATTNPGAFIRIKPVGSLAYDIIGHDQAVFTPHVAQIAFEANKADGAEALPAPADDAVPAADAPKKRRRRRRKPGGGQGGASDAGQGD